MSHICEECRNMDMESIHYGYTEKNKPTNNKCVCHKCYVKLHPNDKKRYSSICYLLSIYWEQLM